MYGNQERSTSYLRQVDVAMLARTGVRLSDVREDLEASPTMPRIADAAEARQDPGEYARAVQDTFGLVDADTRHADRINVRIAALVGFAADTPGWNPGADGAIYSSTGLGVARVKAAHEPTHGRLGFVTALSAEAEPVGRPGVVASPDVGYEHLGGALDIGDAIRPLEFRLSHGSVPGP